MTCSYQFFNIDGTPSAVYNKVTEKKGHSAGLKAYIDSVLVNTTNFSKATVNNKVDIQDIIDNQYIAKDSKLPGVTYTVSNLKEARDPITGKYVSKAKFDEDEQARIIAINAQKGAIEHQDLSIKRTPEQMEKALIKYEEEHPGDLEARIQKAKDGFAASAAWGTDIHAVFQLMFEEFNKLPTKPIPSEYMSVSGNIFRTVKQNNKNLLNGSESIGIHDFEVVFTETLKTIDSLAKTMFKGEDYRIVPELYMADETLGVKGIADLVIVSSSGKVIVFDFKTTTKSMVNGGKAFDRTFGGEFGGPFKHLGKGDSAENSAEIQMSYYNAILAKQGFSPLGIVPIIIEIEMGDVGRTLPNNKSRIGLRKLKLSTDRLELKPSYHEVLLTEKPTIDLTQGLHNTVAELINTEAHNNFLLDNNDPDAYIKSRLKNVDTDPKTGKKFVFRNYAPPGVVDKRLYIDNGTTTAEKILREDINAIIEDQTRLAYNIVNYFNSNKVEVSKSLEHRTDVVDNLLKHISPSTHTLMVASDFDSTLRNIGPDVLIAINKVTGAYSLFSVLSSNNTNFKFSDIVTGKIPRTTFFGKFATDRMVKALGISSESSGAGTLHDAATFKLALVAMQMQANNKKNIVIEEIKAASVTWKGTITTSYMSKELEKFKLMLKFAGPKAPDSMQEMAKNSKVMQSKNYGGSAIEVFKTMLEDSNNFKLYGTDAKNIKESLRKKLAEWEPGQTVSYDTYKDLEKFQRSLHKIRAIPKEELLAIDKAYLDVLAINIYSKQLMTNSSGQSIISKTNLRTAMTSGDVIRERLQVLYNESMRRINAEFLDHIDIQNKLLIELANEYGGDINEAYKFLYEDYNQSKGNHANYMKLKSVDDPSLIGKPASIAFINYFNKKIKENYKKLLSTKDYQKFESGEIWSEGMVPLIVANTGLLNKTTWDTYDSFKAAAQREFEKIAKAKKSFETEEERIKQNEYEYEYKLSKWFTSQLGNDGPQKSEIRLHMLGIDEEGKVVDANKKVETNLAAILNNFTVTTSESQHFATVLSAVGALENVIKDIEESSPDIKHEKTFDVIKDWHRMVIYHEYGNETGPVGTFVDKVSRLFPTLFFGARIGSMATELMTGQVQTMSSLMANSINNFLKTNGGRFEFKDFTKAYQAWGNNWNTNLSSKLHRIVCDHNMLQADAAQLKSKEYADASNWSVFKSNPMFYVQRVFFSSSITHTFLAEMYAKGIVDAYVNKGTENEPKWMYDETLDKRFYVYEEGANYGSKMKTVPPSTPEEKRAYALWKAVRQEMLVEGSLREDGSIRVPLTSKERTDIKFYATKLYGSFNKDTVVAEQTSFIARAMFPYKHWFIQKAANYWTPTDMSEARGHRYWVEDSDMEDGGYWEWSGLPSEGILHSISRLVAEAQESGNLWKTMKELDSIQRENLSKLLADLILLGIITALVAPLFKMDTAFNKSAFGQDLRKAFTNSTSDLLITGTAGTITETMFPALSSAGGSIKNMFNSLGAIASGSEKDAIRYLSKVPKQIGMYSTGYDMITAMFPEPEVKEKSKKKETKVKEDDENGTRK